MAQVIEQTFLDLSYMKGVNEIRRTVKVTGNNFYSDPWRIGEILRNLISNAIKYRKLDDAPSKIEIFIQCSDLSAEILFRDNGIGISTESLERIFEMFYRASDQSDGSGLGLYIVKNAVEKLGGMIKVDSVQGAGTEFWLSLPNH